MNISTFGAKTNLSKTRKNGFDYESLASGLQCLIRYVARYAVLQFQLMKPQDEFKIQGK